MKIVKPFVEEVNNFVQTEEFFHLWKPGEKDFSAFPFMKNGDSLGESEKIQIAGRTCYNSFSRIDLNTDISFCREMIKAGHHPVVEFGHICLQVSSDLWNEIQMSGYKFLNLTKSNPLRYLVSGSIRAWRDFLISSDRNNTGYDFILYKQVLLNFFKTQEDVGFMFDFEFKKTYNGWEKNCKAIIKRLLSLDSDSFTTEERKKHAYTHFVIFTDRAVMAELTRHRNNVSFAIQSQRYVNYKNGAEFVEPHWYNNPSTGGLNGKIKRMLKRRKWELSCRSSESFYKDLVYSGLKPQDARSALNNSTKTIINICANEEEYDHIFAMRCQKAAHPDIQIIANKMKEFIYSGK